MTIPVQLIRLTPKGAGAIASLMIVGKDSAKLLDRHFTSITGRPLQERSINQVTFGHFGGPSGEELVVCRRDQSTVELHCHGGNAVLAWIEQTLLNEGAQALSWQEWYRQTGNDAILAEAHIALAEVSTQRCAGILLDQLNGALRGEVERIIDLINKNSTLALIDVEHLLEVSPMGVHLTEPWRVALCGRPNVGKSSLMNCLAGYERAIVCDSPGTTRDLVTADIILDGWPLRLTDMAGLRHSDDPLEHAGIRLAQQEIQTADLILIVMDATKDITTEESELLNQLPGALVILNKCDLVGNCSKLPPAGPQAFPTSTLTLAGLDELQREITRRLVPAPTHVGQAVPFTNRQIKLLRQAKSQLLSHHDSLAVSSLQRVMT